MVRLALCAFLLAAASLDSGAPGGDLPLVIAGMCVAAGLLATVLLDRLWLGHRGWRLP